MANRAKLGSKTKRDDVSSTASASDTHAIREPSPQHSCSRCKDREPLCFKCHGDAWISCKRCDGQGEIRVPCWCGGAKPACKKCHGSGTFARECAHCSGQGMWACRRCEGRGLFPCGACGRGKVPGRRGKVASRDPDFGAEPPKGLTVTRCHGTEESGIKKLWADRGCRRSVLAVWSVENPHRAWAYRCRRAELEKELGHAPAELRGFHGSAPENILLIAESGFDSGRRAGQAFGAGEYFAKDPSISVSYCKGGSYMLVCQLCLGKESSTEENNDGDHIWVPHCGYYVISSPNQVLPLYIVHFKLEQSAMQLDHVRSARALSSPVLLSQSELSRKLAGSVYRSGVRDESLIDVEFEIAAPRGSVSARILTFAARPAKWWNGDVCPFSGELFHDAANACGVGESWDPRARGKVVLLRRGGGASFAQKEARARAAGALALLVLQAPGEGDAICMTATRASEDFAPTLAAAMLSNEDGERLIAEMHNVPVRLTAARGRGKVDIPPNRPCVMTADSTDALWVGYLHPQYSDNQLAADVRRFLDLHLPGRKVPEMVRRMLPDIVGEVRIVRGKFTQAKISLLAPVSRQDVHALNSEPFVECGTQRTVTVDDAHGSPGQRCPRSIAKYCRGRNLRFVDPCWCQHDELPTARARFSKTRVALESAKGNEIQSTFLGSAPFHDGMPCVTDIQAIDNPVLERQHEFYRRYLAEKNEEVPRQVELYHGTNMNILDTVYTHGLFPPSDMAPSEECPVSGGKGLRTSLCNNDCKFCTTQHLWDRCHMYGLGIYLGDIAQKSHRYVSAAAGASAGRREFKMIICSVLLGDALQLEGHLRCGDALHNVQSLRQLGAGDLPKKVDMVSDYSRKKSVDQCDMLFVKGLGAASRPGFSVFNSEFISFHPYQCLPRYEITYVV